MDLSKPLVSVIIPAYNSEKYIAETLESVRNQTWTELEVFVIDDGSTDRTLDIARTFESDRIRILSQKNSGACRARNYGLELSKGSFIQFLDADDVISPDKIEQQVSVLSKNPGYLGISPTVHFMNGEDYLRMAPREESFWIRNTDDPVDFLIRLYGGDGERWMVQTSAWLTPREITGKIGPWDERLLLDQDGEYFARAVLASSGIRLTGGMNYYRRFSLGSNVSAKAYKVENLRSALLALDLKAGYLGAKTQSERFRQAMATLYQEIAINAYPRFPELVRECELRVRQTGKKPVIPVLGGRLIETTKHLFGWKAAKQLRKLIHELLKKPVQA